MMLVMSLSVRPATSLKAASTVGGGQLRLRRRLAALAAAAGGTAATAAAATAAAAAVGAGAAVQLVGEDEVRQVLADGGVQLRLELVEVLAVEVDARLARGVGV